MSAQRHGPCDEVTIRSQRAVPGGSKAQKRWILAAAVLASTMAITDESVVNVALPRIQSDLHTTLPSMQWVVNAYTLCLSALVLLGGATADRFGRRRMFLIGVALFGVTSIACGLAPGVDVLIAARTIQGLGAALLIPCTLAIIGATFDESERGPAIGIWSGASAVAAGIAPLLGGWLVDHVTWRAIFLINPLVSLFAVWVALRHVPESRDPQSIGGLDWIGSVLVLFGLAGVVFGLIEASTAGWTDRRVIAPLAAGLLLLVGFVVAEQKVAAPMMPLALFRSRTFSGVNLTTLLLYGALAGAFFFLPFLLIQVHGYSATAAGAAFLPFTLVLGVLSKWAGGLIDRFGARGPLAIGPAITGIAFGLLALSSGEGNYWVLLAPMLIAGFGMTVTVAPLTGTVVNAVPSRQTGLASGINNAVASVAGLLTIALLGTVALGALHRSLDEHLAAEKASPALAHVVDQARGGFQKPQIPESLPAEDRRKAATIIERSYVETIRLALFLTSALALCAALISLLMIEGKPRQTSRVSSS
jgi:EmrB/QacA subfamily drug resistance transporter